MRRPIYSQEHLGRPKRISDSDNTRKLSGDCMTS